MRLHIPSPGDVPGVYPIAKRREHLKHLSFTVVELGGSLREYTLDSAEEELSLDFYTGPVRVEAEGAFGRWSADVGPRASIREAAPMMFVPAASRVWLRRLNGPARITVAGALGKPGGEPTLIAGDRIMRKQVGRDKWARTVLTHIADNVDAARLIAGETVSDGGWSSFPPHKHDRFALPSECPMEEVYYFQLDPPQGFGFMRVYTDPDDPERIDESYAVQHGDTVLIPRGYHPVAACPGYTLNYTWVLAGEGRTYGAWRDDPRHVWIRERS